ncbi:MAG: hypothetical protein HOJ90_10795 [Alphaproteobacteria bacterium]|nr:hypothetical protein [Alphaproteobacteria bacterium]
MRGLALVALLLGGLPIATFVATLVLSDGAPLQSPFHVTFAGSGMSAVVHVTPDLKPGQPAQKAHADIPNPIAASPALAWQPPDPYRLARHRTDAAWDRLDRLAADGNRDALMFRTLMQSAEFIRPMKASSP